MKRASSSGTASAPEAKRKVAYATFSKWKVDMDKECQTVTWLDCDTEVQAGKRFVTKLRCSVCTKFKTKIVGRRNFSGRWIAGAESVHSSNIQDHARSDQHEHAMNLIKREQAIVSNAPTSSYAPIAQVLNTLSEGEREQLRRKFDIAYFLAIEKLSFRKYPRLCELEAHHGVSIGNSYTNEIVGKTFSHYIAQSYCQQVSERIVQAQFFSLLMDGSTDSVNVENEVLLRMQITCILE